MALVAPLTLKGTVCTDVSVLAAFELPYESSSGHGELHGVRQFYMQLFGGVFCYDLLVAIAFGSGDEGELKTSLSLYSVEYGGKYGPHFGMIPVPDGALTTVENWTVKGVLEAAVFQAVQVAKQEGLKRAALGEEAMMN